MEKFADRVELLLQKKLAGYLALTELLTEERTAIVDMDIASLWEAATRKKELTRTIESIRNSILHLFDEKGIDHAMDLGSFRLSLLSPLVPGAAREKVGIETARLAIDEQKDEIQRLASENQRYVGDYMGVIDDVISTLIHLTGQEQYQFSGKLCQSEQSNHFIQAEV